VARPPLERRREGVLHDLLREVEVADEADQRREDPSGVRPVEPLDRTG
jgi:hypothetical protein